MVITQINFSLYMYNICQSHTDSWQGKQLRILNPTWQPQSFIYFIYTLKNNAALIKQLSMIFFLPLQISHHWLDALLCRAAGRGLPYRTVPYHTISYVNILNCIKITWNSLIYIIHDLYHQIFIMTAILYSRQPSSLPSWDNQNLIHH